MQLLFRDRRHLVESETLIKPTHMITVMIIKYAEEDSRPSTERDPVVLQRGKLGVSQPRSAALQS